MEYDQQESSEITKLIQSHESLKADYLAALQDHPNSLSVKRPFNPRERPLVGTKPTPDQEVMIDWRSKLRSVSTQLRECFGRFGKEYRLGEFPLAGWESPRLWAAGHEWVIAALDTHVDELRLELESLEPPRRTTVEADHDRNGATLGATLKRTREGRNQTQEEVAEQLDCDVSTVSRIESGTQNPRRKITEAIRRYCGLE